MLKHRCIDRIHAGSEAGFEAGKAPSDRGAYLRVADRRRRRVAETDSEKETAAGGGGPSSNGSEVEGKPRRGSGVGATPAAGAMSAHSSVRSGRTRAARGMGGVGKRDALAAGGRLVPHGRAAEQQVARQTGRQEWRHLIGQHGQHDDSFRAMVQGLS